MLQPIPMSIWQYGPFRKTFISFIIFTITVIILGIVVSISNCSSSYSSCSSASYIYTKQLYCYGTTYCCDPFNYNSCGDYYCYRLDSYISVNTCLVFFIIMWVFSAVAGIQLIVLIIISCQFSRLRTTQALLVPQQNYYAPPVQNPIYYANNGNQYGNNQNQAYSNNQFNNNQLNNNGFNGNNQNQARQPYA